MARRLVAAENGRPDAVTWALEWSANIDADRPSTEADMAPSTGQRSYAAGDSVAIKYPATPAYPNGYEKTGTVVATDGDTVTVKPNGGREMAIGVDRLGVNISQTLARTRRGVDLTNRPGNPVEAQAALLEIDQRALASEEPLAQRVAVLYGLAEPGAHPDGEPARRIERALVSLENGNLIAARNHLNLGAMSAGKAARGELRAAMREVVSAIEQRLYPARTRSQDDEPRWKSTPFAARIESMLSDLQSAGADDMAKAVEAGVEMDATTGRLDEQGVRFREEKARATIAALPVEGVARPVAVWTPFTRASLGDTTSNAWVLPTPIVEAAIARLNELGPQLAREGFLFGEVNGSHSGEPRRLHGEMMKVFNAIDGLAPRRYQLSREHKNLNPEAVERSETFATEVLGVDTRAHPGVNAARQITLGSGVREAKASPNEQSFDFESPAADVESVASDAAINQDAVSPARIDAPAVRNYRITEADALGSGGPKAKFRGNLAAIELLRELSAAGRPATTDEQAVLVKYVGWGGLPQVFDAGNADWSNEHAQLKATLPPEQFEAARRSTQDAHYTAQGVVKAMHAGLQRLGFDGGEVLEPSIGTGNFVGLLPDGLRERVRVTGVELDPTTAGIAKLLYPDARVINKGFQEVGMPNEYFDVVMGNPPFGSQSLYDAEHPELSKLSIHNYFLAKSLEKTRPGGLVAIVVSRYFMDAQDEAAREWIAGRAHLVGAIRLPNTAFKQNAMTDVTTDIVFLQKAREGEVPETGWVSVGTVRDRESYADIVLNSYFVENPTMMLGEMALSASMYRGNSAACVAPVDQDLERDLATAIARLPEGLYRAREPEEKTVATPSGPEVVPEGVKVGAFFVSNERIARRVPDLLDEPMAEWVEAKNEKAAERIRGLIEIRGAVRELMAGELSVWTDDDSLTLLRDRLNNAYDTYVKRHGFISALASRQAFSDDPDYPLLHSLERDYDRGVSKEIAKRDGIAPREPSAKKADIFSRRVMNPVRDISSVESAKDALVVSMNDTGRVDLALMCELTRRDEKAVLEELDGLIFKNPTTGRWDTAEKYLSGNVKTKLAEAIEASKTISKEFERNVLALEGVQPADIDPIDIGIQLGATWVPPDVVKQFVGHLLGNVRADISYQAPLGKWITKIGAADHTTNTGTWGTARAGANSLIESILANSSIQVKDIVGRHENGSPIYEVNEQETAAANQKADEIRQAFLDWVWEDKPRRERLGRIYNDTFNTNVAPKYDGSHLTLPGASLAISLRPHQKDAIWRGIQEGSTLFDHEVGAGKTFVKAAVALESRRMGLMKKPMLVVPNHLLLQWKDSIYALYPNAKVLVAEKSDFTKENRQKLFARIATGDWDAVVIGHSSLKKIGMPPETLEKILTEQIDDLTSAVLELKREKGDRVTIKEMEKAKDRMEAKLKRAADTGVKDRVVTFDELGVDAVLVDELHEFKNLYITTSLSRISGLGNLAGSDKAFDLFVKCRYLQQKHEGRGVFGGTGTPISNTIAELYTVQRFLRYDDLKTRGIHHFDAWASSFGQVVTGWELDATGVNYKLNSRFAKFQNVPELIGMYRTFADVITRKDLEEQAQARGERFPVPKIKTGRPINVIVERSELQSRFMGVQTPVLDAKGVEQRREDGTAITNWNSGSIIHRMENLPKDPREDNPLKVTNDARKAGLDFRLIDSNAPDFAGSKVNALVDEAVRIYEKWKDQKGTQMIFCDLSTPKAKGQKKEVITAIDDTDADGKEEGDEAVVSMDDILASGAKFSVYDDIRAKLIARGVPAEEIAFIHEANTDLQKAKLFDQMNRGEKRFLLGSTAKMGAGTNAQRRLVAKHDLDCPWRPSDLAQRDGRIIRQGNLFYERDPEGFEVELLRYATKQTYDSRMWQTIEYKAAGIEQFRRGDTVTRAIEDVAGEAANAAEMKAAATGNPLIFMQVKIAAELKKLEAVHSNYKRTQHSMESRFDWLASAEQRAQDAVKRAQKQIVLRDANTTNPWSFTAGARAYTNETKDGLLHIVMSAMETAVKRQSKSIRDDSVHVAVGKYRGFEVSVVGGGDAVQFHLNGGFPYDRPSVTYHKSDEFSMSGFVKRLDNVLGQLEVDVVETKRRCERELGELAKLRDQMGKAFPQQERLELLRKDAGDVLSELKKCQGDAAYVSTWTPASEPSATSAERRASPSADDRVALANAALKEMEFSCHLVVERADDWRFVTRQESIEAELALLGYRMEHSLAALDEEGHAIIELDSGDSVDPPNDHVRRLAEDWSELQGATGDSSPVESPATLIALRSVTLADGGEDGAGGAGRRAALARVMFDRAGLIEVGHCVDAGGSVVGRLEAAAQDEVNHLPGALLGVARGLDVRPTNLESGAYTGKVVALTGAHIIQDIGMKASVVHLRSKLEGETEIHEGQALRIQYSGGKGSVHSRGAPALVR